MVEDCGFPPKMDWIFLLFLQGRIRPLSDLKTSVILANALVSSRLDYCNSLFLLLTHFELRRLQLVQNSLCRVVSHSSKFSHITPQLKKLHLPQASKLMPTFNGYLVTLFLHSSVISTILGICSNWFDRNMSIGALLGPMTAISEGSLSLGPV